MFIYETTNLLNGKKYRGAHKTDDLNDDYFGSGTLIDFALRKYGKQNFTREILEFCDSVEHMYEREQHYVNKEWVDREDTYNLRLGGLGGDLCEEVIAKISNTLKERYRNQPHHLKGKLPWNANKTGVQTAWNKGISTGPMSDEEKIKRSNTLKDRYAILDHPTKGIRYKRKNIPPAWNKGKILQKFPCPHCGKLADKSNLKQWHLDNCKMKKEIN